MFFCCVHRSLVTSDGPNTMSSRALWPSLSTKICAPVRREESATVNTYFSSICRMLSVLFTVHKRS